MTYEQGFIDGASTYTNVAYSRTTKQYLEGYVLGRKLLNRLHLSEVLDYNGVKKFVESLNLEALESI